MLKSWANGVSGCRLPASVVIDVDSAGGEAQLHSKCSSSKDRAKFCLFILIWLKGSEHILYYFIPFNSTLHLQNIQLTNEYHNPSRRNAETRRQDTLLLFFILAGFLQAKEPPTGRALLATGKARRIGDCLDQLEGDHERPLPFPMADG